MITRLLGGVREETKVNLVERSTFVGRIRKLLHLQPVTRLAVKSSRADAIRRLNALSDAEFAVYASELATLKS